MRILLALILAWVPPLLAQEEKAGLILNFPPGWRVAESKSVENQSMVVYLPFGERTFKYSRMVTQETIKKSSAVDVGKVRAGNVKRARSQGCKTVDVSKSKDGKRSMFRYGCEKRRRSGLVLTVEGDDGVIYSVTYELPKPFLGPHDRADIFAFLDKNARICKRSDRKNCVR